MRGYYAGINAWVLPGLRDDTMSVAQWYYTWLVRGYYKGSTWVLPGKREDSVCVACGNYTYGTTWVVRHTRRSYMYVGSRRVLPG